MSTCKLLKCATTSTFIEVFNHMLYKDGASPVYYNGVLNPMYYGYSVNNTLCLEK
jgi:hypothetical protein